ncbi:MAG TPA: zinc-binding dehydrogenase [Pyrinomonadaceae bacterium]|nr:zinc-binding dehydrogenase [Pyrinomonadaceae bacterium]
MKAAVLEKLNSPLVIDELNVPDLECGQVLVEVRRSGICGAQIGEIAGVKGEDKYLPHLMGHEGGGVVLDIGPGVTKVKKNDHVVMHWRKGPGIEARPPRYKRDKGFVGGGWVTTFNELSVVSENRLTVIPDDIPFEIAALMGCAVTTALGLINNEAALKIGESIALAGCGGVGLNIIQGAAMVSANPIIAIDIFDHKLKLAQEFGATHVINNGKEDLREAVKRIAGKTGVDVFVDCTGNVEIMEQCYELTGPKGRTIMVGQPRIEKNLVLGSMVRNFTGKSLTDSQGGGTDPAVDIPRYLDLYRLGKLKLDRLMTHRFTLDDINTALEKMRSGETGRTIIEF